MQAVPTKPGIEAKLSGALGRKDEAPNIKLAEKIAQTNDRAAVSALAAILDSGVKRARHDAIKVLYEIGERNPPLILELIPAFLALLSNKDNRLVWGGLTALAALNAPFPDKIFPHLSKILAAADAGSIIAKDRAIDILVSRAAETPYSDEVLPIILARLAVSAINQLPIYAEKVSRLSLTQQQASEVAAILKSRLNEPTSPAKKRRLEKTIKTLSQLG